VRIRRWSARRGGGRNRGGVEADTIGVRRSGRRGGGRGRGGVETDVVGGRVGGGPGEAIGEETMVQAWRRADGGEIILSRVRVRVPHT
jgi:hypothetical protein